MVKKTTKNIIATPTIITQIETTPVVTTPDVSTPDVTTPVAKKRGRKSKKELELAQNNKIEEQNNLDNVKNDNINIIIEDPNNNNNKGIIESKNILDNKDLISCDTFSENENVIEDTLNFLNNVKIEDDTKPMAKKRGRKPKGGKIIQQIVPSNNNKEVKPNIILHLKCSLKDLQSTTLLGSELGGFNFPNTNQLSYDSINIESNIFNQSTDTKPTDVISIQSKSIKADLEYDDKSGKDNDIREVWKKLKVLEHNLHMNNICDKKSSCFWCTYDFDNPPIYIPKHFIKDSYHVYGCFCSPECATAYLMEENIDSSAKFERYHLINHIYTKIYDYKKNVKPAPNPYYMLDKYYGNLSIQEYRSLLRNERLFLVVDKPLTRILPELHEDNDDFIINNKIIPSNTYQFKRKLPNKQTKTTILSEKFGLTQ